MPDPISMTSIGVVRSPITEPVDDIWGGVVSRIELDASRFNADSLAGLDQYSHTEIFFVLDRIDESGVIMGARHPRGRTDWPKVGIFAQRAKNRPNRLAATVCRIVSVKDLAIEVEGLDAIDGTPVLDIKPYLSAFRPQGDVRQPEWATELMSKYWGQGSER